MARPSRQASGLCLGSRRPTREVGTRVGSDLPTATSAKRPAPMEAGLSQEETAGQLLDAETADGPGDDELLDLLGAFEDVHDLGVAVPALDGVLAGVAVATEDLDGPLGDPDRRAAGVELGLAALGVLVLAVAGEPRGAPHEEAGGVDLHAHVGE